MTTAIDAIPTSTTSEGVTLTSYEVNTRAIIIQLVVMFRHLFRAISSSVQHPAMPARNDITRVITGCELRVDKLLVNDDGVITWQQSIPLDIHPNRVYRIPPATLWTVYHTFI